MSAATKTYRRSPLKPVSAHSSAHSACHAPILSLAVSAQTAGESWWFVLGVRPTSWPTIHPRPTAFTTLLVARRPSNHGVALRERNISILIDELLLLLLARRIASADFCPSWLFSCTVAQPGDREGRKNLYGERPHRIRVNCAALRSGFQLGMVLTKIWFTIQETSGWAAC